MSRSGYSDDYYEAFPNAEYLYSYNVDRAIQGKRGQKFLRDLITALDAMPVKRLIQGYLVNDGEVCTIGAVGISRGIDMNNLDPDDSCLVAKKFGISECLVREITFQNDEHGDFGYHEDETPEQTWRRMRDWATKCLAKI